MDSLLNDNPIILDEHKDLLGTIKKVKLLKEFFDNHENFLNEEKMMAIYGEWGSGKSSIMKTLIESDDPIYRLNKDNFRPLFFKAWKYESDDNLAFSLFEFIMEEINSSWKEEAKDKIEEIYSTIKGFAKGVKLNLGVVSLSTDKAIGDIEKLHKKRLEEQSFYKRKNEFEKAFNKLLENEDKKIVVFIDDLDRCESENILNLLSAIKLFFTLGKNIIFVCGIDKNAVKRALKIRYGNDDEKAEEYLEKIFNISFSMPKRPELQKLIQYYFGEHQSLNYIETFFKYIDFNTPRHLKKILNKYSILAKIKEDQESEFKQLIPNIITNENNDNIEDKVFNTMYVLYIIILYEFYNDKYYVLKNYQRKLNNYRMKILYKDTSGKQSSFNPEHTIKLNLNELKLDFLLKEDNKNDDISKLAIFTPKLNEKVEVNWIMSMNGDVTTQNKGGFLQIFPEDILLKFAKFIFLEILDKDVDIELDNNYYYKELFEMAEVLL